MTQYTIITDIDGCLLEHEGDHTNILQRTPKILYQVREKMNEWSKAGHKLILMTARRESSRARTEDQLRSLGLFWDHLLMGVGNGPRVLINDLKPDNHESMAVGVNIKRNIGFNGIDLDAYREKQNEAAANHMLGNSGMPSPKTTSP